MVLVVALASCKKTPEVNLKYVDVERDLITVGTTTATVQCDYKYIATLKKAYFYYGEGENEADMNTAEMRVVQNTLYVDLAGLKENTTYSYYYEFLNGFNSMRTVAKTFKTETTPIVMILPTVITAEVSEIAEYSAQCGGEVTNDGGAEVTERGICWSTNENPTLNDNHVAAGVGLGVFAVLVDSLQDNTIYHVRAYAINEAGTAYGLDREFTTLRDVPEGAIDGLFTINENGNQVYFSRGNIQYQASTNTWRFAENQWDYVGNGELGTVYEGDVKCDNSLISSTYSGWIDLFGWGTSGWNSGANCYQPWSNSYNGSDYYPGGNNNNNLNGDYAYADWGVYNAFINGGNQSECWRTLLQEEFDYLLNLRNTLSGIRYAKATVNDVNGAILLPDNWNDSYYSLNSPNQDGVNFSSNVLSASQWNAIEQYGAIFLPAAGYREGTYIGRVNTSGDYWTASYYNNTFSWGVENCDTDHNNVLYIGRTVRLAQDAKP